MVIQLSGFFCHRVVHAVVQTLIRSSLNEITNQYVDPFNGWSPTKSHRGTKNDQTDKECTRPSFMLAHVCVSALSTTPLPFLLLARSSPLSLSLLFCVLPPACWPRVFCAMRCDAMVTHALCWSALALFPTAAAVFTSRPYRTQQRPAVERHSCTAHHHHHHHPFCVYARAPDKNTRALTSLRRRRLPLCVVYVFGVVPNCILLEILG